MGLVSRFKNFIALHPEIFTVLGLCIIFYIIFFHNIGSYALMDVDESRYVSMAKDMFQSKDYLTLYLNNEYFFEKPPLYFWGECISFKLFGKINEFTARFPVALYGAACCFLMYIMGRKIISRRYGIFSALILATSLEFFILAKFAILDIVVSTCIGFSVCLGMVVYFCRESRKKYYWWLFYIFSALAVMAKGIPGFIIPFGSMFLIALISNKVKEIFKPIYIIPGITLFLLITLPWHIIMFKLYNPLFWDEYIIKHHLARFLGSDVIKRQQPFYFYFITLLWGFFPWIVSCLCVWVKNTWNILKSHTIKLNFDRLTAPQKYMTYNSVIVIFILLFFSASETKLITYILPVYASLSAIAAYIWLNFIDKKENEKLITGSIYFLSIIFFVATIGCILTPIFLPKQLYSDISSVKTFCTLSTFAAGLLSLLFTKKRMFLGVFITYVIYMALCSAHLTEKFFEIDYKFGQNDLLRFAKYAKEKNLSLTTFGFGHKYSLIYYGGKPVIYGVELEKKDFKNALQKDKNLVIIKHKDLDKINSKKFVIIESGRKYALVDERK